MRSRVREKAAVKDDAAKYGILIATTAGEPSETVSEMLIILIF